VCLEEGVELERCISMDYVRIKRGARLNQVIVDRYNTVGAGTSIGFDPNEDKRRYQVSPSGIVVVPSGAPGRDTPSFEGGYI
jgi:glucose-1-phosphate adenylyltransferase